VSQQQFLTLDGDADDARSYSERIAYLIRKQINLGSLKPGDRVPPERALAEQLGVARSVVREALKELRAQGYVSCGRGRQGTIVAARSDASFGRSLSELMESEIAPLADLNELRMGLEVQAAGLAAWRRVPDDIATLDNIVAAMAAKADERRIAELDAAFHGAVAQAAHNVFYLRLTAEFVRLLQDYMPTMYAVDRMDASSLKQQMIQHRAIVTAIRNRDVEGARRAMTVHLSWVVQELQEFLSLETMPNAPEMPPTEGHENPSRDGSFCQEERPLSSVRPGRRAGAPTR
jgi:GntR family transcriptional regulator, transcriptional repressor for pyruvate dehydrogenase complex